MPNPPFNRWSPETVERAGEVRAWMDDETSAGRDVGEDEVWAFVTERWPSIPTGHAEHVLNLAMDAHAASTPSRQRIANSLKEAFETVCDGTMGNADPAGWSLEVGPGLPGGTLADLIEDLAEKLTGPPPQSIPGPRG